MTAEERYMAASSKQAAAKVTPSATVVDTPEGIERFRMIVCLSGLKLESKGIKVRRGQSCLSIARHDYGIKAGTAAKAYELMRAEMLRRGIIVGQWP